MIETAPEQLELHSALLGGLGYFGGGDARPGVAGLLILTAAVLFAVAGGLFWTLRERAD